MDFWEGDKFLRTAAEELRCFLRKEYKIGKKMTVCSNLVLIRHHEDLEAFRDFYGWNPTNRQHHNIMVYKASIQKQNVAYAKRLALDLSYVILYNCITFTFQDFVDPIIENALENKSKYERNGQGGPTFRLLRHPKDNKMVFGSSRALNFLNSKFPDTAHFNPGGPRYHHPQLIQDEKIWLTAELDRTMQVLG
jgi:hypothetical protein